METLEAPAALAEPELEVAVEDDDRTELVMEELRAAIRRKLAPPDSD